MQNLKSVALLGVKWMLLRQVFSQSIRIVTTIVLTRIISPEDFGLVAKTIAITGICELILQSSVSGSIVQKQDTDKEQLNSLFIIIFLFTSILTFGLYISSESIARFYQDFQVIWIIKVSSISIFFTGIGLIFHSLLLKNFRYREIAIVSISSTILSAIIAVILAYLGYGFKALIVQTIVLNIISTLGAVYFSHWFPIIKLSFHPVTEHLRFGRNVLLNNLLTYSIRNSDNVAIGKFQSDIVLGYYSRAYFLFFFPLNQLSQVINTVLFPLFSRIQNEKERIFKVLNLVQEVIILLIFPAIILIYFNIELIILKLLGEVWLPSIIFFKIFTPLLLIQIFTLQISTVFMSLNKMGALLKISILTKPFITAAIIIAAMRSATTVAIVISVLSGISSFYTYYVGIRYLGTRSFVSQILYLKKPLLIVVVFSTILFVVNYFLTAGTLLIASVILWITLYSYIFFFEKKFLNEIISLFKIERS